MSKFIRNIFIFSVPVLFCVLFVEYVVRQVPNNYSYKNEYLANNAENIEVLILGSSHSFRDVDPDYFQARAFNASHVSQTPKHDYCIFSKYKNRFAKLKVLVLPISYFTLFSQLEDGREKWRAKNYQIYYGCSDRPSFTNRFEVLNLEPLEALKLSARYLVSGGEYSNITVSELGLGLTLSGKTQVDLIETGMAAAKRHTKNNFRHLESNFGFLNKLVAESSRMNVNVFLFTPPAWVSYRNNLDQNQLNEMIKSINNITSQYSNVSYHSFLQDERFLAEDFRDGDHLNLRGAKKLSELIDQMINSELSIE